MPIMNNSTSLSFHFWICGGVFLFLCLCLFLFGLERIWGLVSVFCLGGFPMKKGRLREVKLLASLVSNTKKFLFF